MSEQNIDQLFLENTKLANQLVNKRTLASLIEDTEELHDYLVQHSKESDNWQKSIIRRNLKHLKILNQRLGYEQ